MQKKLFTVPVGDNGGALQELNAFMRGNKVIEVEQKLIHNENGAYWCSFIRTLAGQWDQRDYQRHMTPLAAFTLHAAARAFRQAVHARYFNHTPPQ
jgi:hypothetical protein